MIEKDQVHPLRLVLARLTDVAEAAGGEYDELTLTTYITTLSELGHEAVARRAESAVRTLMEVMDRVSIWDCLQSESFQTELARARDVLAA